MVPIKCHWQNHRIRDCAGGRWSQHFRPWGTLVASGPSHSWSPLPSGASPSSLRSARCLPCSSAGALGRVPHILLHVCAAVGLSVLRVGLEAAGLLFPLHLHQLVELHGRHGVFHRRVPVLARLDFPVQQLQGQVLERDAGPGMEAGLGT